MKLHTNHINIEYYTERNKKILLMRANGKSINEIADTISISSRRVESIIFDLRCQNRCVNELQLIATAFRKGIIQ